MKVLGLKASYLVAPEEYDKTRFKKNIFYNFIAQLTDKSFLFYHIKNIIKSKIYLKKY